MSKMSLNAVGEIVPDIAFTRQLGGYDKVQVCRYIKKLTDAYKTAYSEYIALSRKYADLLDKYSVIEQRAKHNDANADIVSKTLIDAEIKARNIISTARMEAERIKEAADMDKAIAERSVEAANEALAETISRLQSLVTG